MESNSESVVPLASWQCFKFGFWTLYPGTANGCAHGTSNDGAEGPRMAAQGPRIANPKIEPGSDKDGWNQIVGAIIQRCHYYYYRCYHPTVRSNWADSAWVNLNCPAMPQLQITKREMMMKICSTDPRDIALKKIILSSQLWFLPMSQ